MSAIIDHHPVTTDYERGVIRQIRALHTEAQLNHNTTRYFETCAPDRIEKSGSNTARPSQPSIEERIDNLWEKIRALPVLRAIKAGQHGRRLRLEKEREDKTWEAKMRRFECLPDDFEARLADLLAVIAPIDATADFINAGRKIKSALEDVQHGRQEVAKINDMRASEEYNIFIRGRAPYTPLPRPHASASAA